MKTNVALSPSVTKNMPTHVGLVMDGNGRWAKQRGLSRIEGHQRGAERLRDIVKICPELGVQFLTAFAFSTENWKRGDEEVNGLVDLFRKYIGSESRELVEKGIKIKFIGNRTAFDQSLVDQMCQLELASHSNDKLVLTIAINYGGRDEIVKMAQAVATQALAGHLNVEQIDESVLNKHSFTHYMPDPELIIRTSGETRISNFLLWQVAYSEIVFDDVLWPEFTPERFKEHVANFEHKIRRFGSITMKV